MMFFLRTCLMAFQALRANLLRSVLATLGVIIGVAAVISAISILEGTERNMIERFRSLGSDLVTVFPSQVKREGRAVGIARTLKAADVDAIMEECDLAEAAAPEILSGAQVKYLGRNRQLTVVATNPSYQDIFNYHTIAGRFVSGEDVAGELKVTVLGHRVARELFGFERPIGKSVRISGQSFYVIGVMEKKGTIGVRDVDMQAILPPTACFPR